MVEYIIYKDGEEFNRIMADEAFCQRYYSDGGYSYEPAPPEPAPPEPEPIDPSELPPTVEELQAEQVKLKAQVAMLESKNTFLEDCLLEMADEVYA